MRAGRKNFKIESRERIFRSEARKKEQKRGKDKE